MAKFLRCFRSVVAFFFQSTRGKPDFEIFLKIERTLLVFVKPSSCYITIELMGIHKSPTAISKDNSYPYRYLVDV